MIRTRKLLWGGMLLGFAGMGSLAYFYVEHIYITRIDYLENLVVDARQREERAVVVRRVSKQMEEIAYQQKEISDRQRKQAEWQAGENFRMKLRVEEEWKKAVAAQQEALTAYRLADRQKALAEERQYQAEYAKRVADTLACLTLGRSLGSLSITQHHTGNEGIASLLAYAAWSFTGRYQGDVFLPSVFNSLSLSAGQTSAWQNHKGGVTAIVFASGAAGADRFYTAGKYGEILLWEKDARDGYRTKSLFSGQQFDFRAACIGPHGGLYALSFDGRLLEFSGGRYQVFPLKGKNYIQMVSLDGKLILLSATEGLVIAGEEQPLYHRPDISCIGKEDGCLLAGHKNGDVVRVDLSGKADGNVANYYPFAVTAFGYCPLSGRFAIGYEDGTILLFHSREASFQRLVGHRSAVTSILLHENKLYSCSYDRTLRLWNLSADRMEPVVVLEGSAWLRTLALVPDRKLLLAGDEGGTLYRLSVSPDSMAARIKRNLPRDFTPEEWAYYVGSRIPFEHYTSKEHDL